MKYCVLLLSAVVFSANGICQFHTTVFRQLRKDGFHLELSSSVEIVTGSDECPTWEDCTIALAEPVGSSFFIKPNEISRGSVAGCSLQRFNVEDPQNKSTQGIVYLYSPLQVSLNLAHAELFLPLHLRYHSPTPGGGYVLTLLKQPEVLLQCRTALKTKQAKIVRRPCPICSETDCDWIQLPYKTNTANFTVPVPVGDTNYLTLVAFVTYLLAIGGCCYISLTIANTVNGF